MSEMNEVLVSMEEVKEQIANASDLEKLHANPIFQKLILQDYFIDEASQLVSVMAHPMNEMGEKQMINKMVGISALRAYFNSIHRKGETAKASLADHEATVNEIAAEL